MSLLEKRSRSGQSGLESFLVGDIAGMIFEDLLWIGGFAIIALVVTALLVKELQLVAFDAEFARVQGWPTGLIDLLLMLLIALAVVLGLPAVGALLVAALLVIPAAAARFWTNRLPTMLVLAGAIGMVSGALGTLITIPIAMPTGPVIIVVATLIFGFSVAFGGARGLLVKRAASRAA